MLTTGQATAPAKSEHIKDGTDATFMADVVEMSQTVPVIVDFWATWCGPCKTLGPAIEGAVAKAKGAVKLVKIDVDANPMISQQARIQSIPTVYAFWKGQPVDGFQGALPPSEVDKFVAKVAAMGNGAAEDDEGGLEEALAAAEELLAEGAVADAIEIFSAVIAEDKANAAAVGGLVRAYVALGDFDSAEVTLQRVPKEIVNAPEIDNAFAKLALARQASNAGPEDDLRAKVEADPADHQARFDLATALHASGKVQEAVDQLLELFRRDREWNEGAAKAQLFTIFDALPAKDPIVLAGRRKLSSMIFA